MLISKMIFIVVLTFINTTIVWSQEMPKNSASLFKRYKTLTSLHRIGEDIFNLSFIEQSRRDKIAIRLCSKNVLPYSLLDATADPFAVADKLLGYAYPPSNLFYLFSKECAENGNKQAITEIWTMPQNASFPLYEQAIEVNRVSFVPMGNNISNRGMKDYKYALNKLVKELQKDPEALGVIWGYYLENLSSSLKNRIKESSSLLKRKNIEMNRYITLFKQWNDEVSTYPPDKEPIYPNIYLLKIKKVKSD